MNKELQLGTIQYKWGKLDSTFKVEGDLFNDFMDQGADSLVYNGKEYVYKIDKDVYYSLEELQEAANEKILLTSYIKEFEPLYFIGYVKVLGFDAYHIVYKQKQLRQTLKDEWNQLLLDLHNDGWNPHRFSADKKGLSIYDVNIWNTGVDENGNVKLIDCKIYNRELELKRMAGN